MRVYTKENIDRIEKFLRDATEHFSDMSIGCSRFMLGHHLALFVGWLPGYDPADNATNYVDKNGWGLNAGIKIVTCDFADYDWLEAPIWNDNGEVADTDVTISRQQDFRALARYYLKEYIAMKKFIDKGLLSVNI